MYYTNINKILLFRNSNEIIYNYQNQYKIDIGNYIYIYKINLVNHELIENIFVLIYSKIICIMEIQLN